MASTAQYTFAADVVFADTLLDRHENRAVTVPDGFYDWADDQIKYMGYYKKKKKEPVGKVTCTHCHNTFVLTQGINTTYSPFETTCPHCGKRLEAKLVPHAQALFSSTVYVGLHCSINGIDCVRVFRKHVYEDVRIMEQNHRYDIRKGWCEFARLWHGPEGEKYCTRDWMYGYRWLDIKTESLQQAYHRWIPCSYWSYSNDYRPEDVVTHSATMVIDHTDDPHLPILRACLGVLKSKAILHRVIDRVFTIPMIETLVKAGHLKAAGYVANRGFDRGKFETERRPDCDNPMAEHHGYVPVPHIGLKEVVGAMKLCVRHKYDYGNIDQYVDYLDRVFMAGLDMRSPKYVCPADREQSLATINRRIDKMDEPRLRRMAEWNVHRAERDAIRDAARRAEQAANAEQMRKWLEQSNETYRESKQEFLDIKFKTDDGRFAIHVLQSVDEFREEGKHMHHCVYQMGYYKNQYSVILSCRNARTDARVSTIELWYNTSTRKCRIAQNRGACNSTPPDYKIINQTITAHFDEFQEAFEKMNERLATAKAEKAAAAKRAADEQQAVAV